MSITTNFPAIRPTLNLDFVNSLTVDPRITFTRASTATYFDRFGVLRTAAVNEPRIDFDPATGECKGLLIEEQRTNLLTWSQEFNHPDWHIVANVSITPNTSVAPDGTLSADTITVTGASDPRLQRNLEVADDSTQYAFSVYIKKTPAKTYGGGIRAALERGAAVRAGLIINTQTGAVIDSYGTVDPVQDVGSYWRLTIRLQNNSTGNTLLAVSLYPSSENRPGEFNEFWGAQLEVGAFPTSYIPTTSAQVTRSADSAVMTGTNFSSWYRPDEGTVYVEAISQVPVAGNTGGRVIFDIGDAAARNRISISQFPAAGADFYVSTPGGDQVTGFSIPNIFTTGVVGRAAAAYRVNDFALSSNGAAAIVDTSGLIPVVDRARIGATTNGIAPFCGTIRRIAYYPARLPDAKLQAITA